MDLTGQLSNLSDGLADVLDLAHVVGVRAETRRIENSLGDFALAQHGGFELAPPFP